MGILLDRLGEPVPLQVLLLANGLHNATSRRVRTLANEHGHFPLRRTGRGEDTAYLLEHGSPDLDATADYWLMRNIRDESPKRISPHERLVALLSARLGEAVPLDDLGHVLPKQTSSGKGRARVPQTAVARRIRELREQGWQVQSAGTRVGLRRSDYLLGTLESIPEYERMSATRREEALKAAMYRCRHCGWGPEDGPSNGRKQLEIHHRTDPQRSRAQDVHRLANLEVLCNLCHSGVEAEMKRDGAARSAVQEGD